MTKHITKEEFIAELDLDKSLAENASIVCPKKNISISTFKYLVWKHKVKFNKDGRTGCKKPSLKKCNKELPAYIVEYRFKDFLKKLELIHPDIFNAYTEGTLRQYYKRRRKELGIKRSKKIEDPMAKTLDKKDKKIKEIKETVKKNELVVKKDELLGMFEELDRCKSINASLFNIDLLFSTKAPTIVAVIHY